MGEQEPDAKAVVRLSVNLHPDVAARLDRMAELQALTRTEGIRRAINLWAYVEGETQRGKKLAVLDGDGKVEREVVLL